MSSTIWDLTELATLQSTDEFPVGRDPDTKKVTVATMRKGIGDTLSSAYASAPSSPVAGDLWLPTDSFYILRHNGSAWVPWGPLDPMVLPPSQSTFSWSNQGSATATDDKGTLLVSVTNGAGEVLRTLHKSTPATPWSLIVAFEPILYHAAACYCGLVFRESSSGNTHAFRFHHDGTLTSTKHDSGGAGVAHYVGATAINLVIRPVNWLKIEDNGTNRICSYSSDGGREWIVFHTVSRTDYLTANQAGVFVGGNNSNRAAMRVLSFAGI